MPLKTRRKNRALVYEVMGRLKEKYRINPVFLFIFLFQAIRPLLWLRVVKFGRREFRIPVRLSPFQQHKKSVKWVIRAALQRSESTVSDKLFFEFVDLLAKRSKVFVWRKNLINDIKKNRHNVHFKW